jgi:diguanylate cyclase (GGDEF)-like protein/PAS domain S-box-containing protein
MIDQADKASCALWSIENSPDGIFWTDPGGYILYANKAFCEETGYSEEDFLDMNVLDLDPMIRSKDLGLQGKLAFPVRQGDIARLSSLYRHKDGHLIPVEVTMSVPRDDGLLIVCFIRNKTEEHAAEEQLGAAEHTFALERGRLMRAASIDFLTGTWLRRYFFEIVESSIRESESGGTPLSLIMLDLDRFKQVNDTYGHNAGDAVLVEFCKTVASAIREDDYFVRWGGDEFVVLMPGLDVDGAKALGERLVALVSAHRFGRASSITMSAGVAERLPGEAIDVWMGRADAALYRAKSFGGNRVEQ